MKSAFKLANHGRNNGNFAIIGNLQGEIFKYEGKVNEFYQIKSDC